MAYQVGNSFGLPLDMAGELTRVNELLTGNE